MVGTDTEVGKTVFSGLFTKFFSNDLRIFISFVHAAAIRSFLFRPSYPSPTFFRGHRELSSPLRSTVKITYFILIFFLLNPLYGNLGFRLNKVRLI